MRSNKSVCVSVRMLVGQYDGNVLVGILCVVSENYLDVL